MTPFVTVDEFFNYTGLKVGSLVISETKTGIRSQS